MNKLKTPLVDKVLSDKEDLSLVDSELALMDFKINSARVDKEEVKASPSEIYSMSSRRCLVVVVAKEGLNNNR
jgi:hypothetical protein